MSAYNLDGLFGTGVIDFAGSGVVHIVGGTAALIAAKFCGYRGQYDSRARKRFEFVNVWFSSL
jgi:ammonia channel protein AmtB